MKAVLITVIAVFSLLLGLRAQIPACSCPEDKAAAMFSIGANITVSVCGFKDSASVNAEVLFSEFTLLNCGDGKVIGRWGADQRCRIYMKAGSLYVDEVIDLPTGHQYRPQLVLWCTNRFTWRDDQLIEEHLLNAHLLRYTPAQIAGTLTAYRRARDINSETTVDLAGQLFVAALSGSKEAERDLINFKKKFTALDGAYGEDYDRIIERYKIWRQHSK